MDRSLYQAAAVACLSLALVPRSAPALIVVGYQYPSDPRYDRFQAGTNLPNSDPSFIGAGYNFSGIGANITNSGWKETLISPRNTYSSDHVAPSPGDTIDFTTLGGQERDITMQAVQRGIGADICIGTLSTAVNPSDNLGIYSFLFLGYNPSSYTGMNLLLNGWTNKFGTNQVTGVNDNGPGSYNTLYYNNYLTTAGSAQVQLGDSSHPTFFYDSTDHQLMLAGCHYSYGIDSFGSANLADINVTLATTGYVTRVVTPITQTWTGAGGDGSFGSAANWSAQAGQPAVPADTMTIDSITNQPMVYHTNAVLLNGGASTQRAITLGAARQITGITFAAAAGANGFTFANDGNTLTLGEAGINNQDDDRQVFNGPVAARASQWWTGGRGGLTFNGDVNTNGFLVDVEGSADNYIAGKVTGAGGIANQGPGTLTVSGTPNFTGGLHAVGGTLKISQPTLLASGQPMQVESGAVLDVGGTPQSISALNGGGGRYLVGDLAISNSTANASSAFAGAIVGSGGVTKDGTSTLTLSGPSEYTGATVLRGGTLIIAADAPAGAVGPLGKSTSPLMVGDSSTTTSDLFLQVTPGTTLGRDVNVNDSKANVWIGVAGTGEGDFSGHIVLNKYYTTYLQPGSASSTLVFKGPITGGQSFTTFRQGTVVLDSNANTIDGAVSDYYYSTLYVNGWLHAGGGTSVQAQSFLGGVGTVDSNVTVTGWSGTTDYSIIGPGDQNGNHGRLTITGDVKFSGTSASVIGSALRLHLMTPSDHDSLAVGGQLMLDSDGQANGAMLDLQLAPDFTGGSPGDFITLIDNQGSSPISGTFNGILENQEFNFTNVFGQSYIFQYLYNGGDGNDFGLRIVSVPEPGIASLLVAFGAATVGMRQRRRKSPQQ